MSSNEGHRKRLRTKFLGNGFAGFLDYEVVELLLTIGIPRKDCKPIAKELIKRFKTVSGVVNADESDLKKIKGLGDSSIFGIKLVREFNIHTSREDLVSKSNDISVDDVAQLAVKEIGHSRNEVFKVYCLNTKGLVISGIVSVGVLDASVVHPRELFKLAIENNAASVVVAHNHPSGDISPSQEDISTTRRLVEAGKILGIELDDHIIVSSSGYLKLSEAGYL